MKKHKNTASLFNSQDTLLVITSFPKKGGELAEENAVAWYVHQLLSHFPSDQKVVVLCEKRSEFDSAWKLKNNVLVVPTFTTTSAKFFSQVLSQVKAFEKVTNVLIQFEFNSFKSNFITGGIPLLLATLKRSGKRISFAMHQVIDNVTDLSGHLQVQPGSVKAHAFNLVLRSFYRSINIFVDHVIVFDEELRQRLRAYVDSTKIQVIPMGIEEAPSIVEHRTARRHFSLNQDTFVILAFGYQSWYKGTDWIVREVGKLATKYPKHKIRLLLAGGKSPTVDNQVFQNELELALHKYQDVVVETGYVSDEMVPHCFAAADITVLPYRAMMSSSGTLSHALSYEKPFFLSAPLEPVFKHEDFITAASTSKVSSSDLLFSLDTKSFQKKMIHVLESPLLQKRLKRMARTLKSARSWKNIGRKYMNVIDHERITTMYKNKQQKLPELSVFFPLYNEAKNVHRLVHHTLAALPKIAKRFEVILVDDGSTDGTGQIADKLAKKHCTVRVIHQPNGGYGKALRTGFESAKYEWIFFSDGDLQFDINELDLFLPHVTTNDVVIGYRKNRADSPKRLFLANMLKVWNRIFFSFPSGIKDIDCAFKLFHRRAVSAIFPLQSYGAMISTEMLLKTLDNGLSFAQVGVTHLPRQFGEPTGAKPHVILGAVKETFKILSARLNLTRSQILSSWSIK